MTLPFVSTLGNVSGEFYASLLRSAYAQIRRVYEPDFALSREPDLYEKVLRDPVIAHAVMLRCHNVAGRDWSLEPASDHEDDVLAARYTENLIRRYLHGFSESRYELAQAVFRGRAYAYIDGRRITTSPAREVPPAEWWVPVRLHDVDKRRIRIVPEWDMGSPEGPQDTTLVGSNGKPAARPSQKVHPPLRHLRTFMELFSVERGQWERIEHPEFWIVHVYQNEEARLGYGRGLIESMYFYWLLKSELLRRASEAAARYAKGVIGFGLDTLRPASDDRTNDEIVQKVIEVVDAMMTRGVIVHGKEDEVNFHEPAAQGAQFILTMIEYIDQTLTRLAFGSVLPAGISEGTGSLARAEVEFDVSESVIQYDRDILDETITRDLIGLFWRLNRANFVALGLGDAQPPRFRSHRRKSHDPKEMIGVIQAALASGIPLRKDEVYRTLGFTPPKPDEDVIVGGSVRGPAEEGALPAFPATGFVAPISTPTNPTGPRLSSSPDGNGTGT